MVWPLRTLPREQHDNRTEGTLILITSHHIFPPTMHSFRSSQNDDEPGSARTSGSSVNYLMGPTYRSLSSCSRPGRSSSSSRAVQRSASARFARQNTTREVMLNDIVGNGISGILYKWVNYGRGWRPRWFVLHDGVLSYYKIHGPDKLVLNREVETGSKVIGEESLRRISSQRHCPSRLRKPVSEIHLMVSSVRENRSDERRFSICTGTKKRLHLRAGSREDRATWVEAVMAVKDMYPRLPSTAEIMSPTVSVVISTDKLRQRLLHEGVSEVAICESEEIMRAELYELHKHIVALKQKQLLLMDTLRHLETEKVDLENTLVEDQRQSKDEGYPYLSTHEKYSGTWRFII